MAAAPHVGDDPALGDLGQDVERGGPVLLSKDENGVQELGLFESETFLDGPMGGNAELAWKYRFYSLNWAVSGAETRAPEFYERDCQNEGGLRERLKALLLWPRCVNQKNAKIYYTKM